MNSGSWWWTGRPGVLQFMGSQRVGHDWVTELNWKSFINSVPFANYSACLCLRSEKAMATHSSTLAWKIPWAEEPGRLPSMGSLRVGHDWATSLSLFTFVYWRKKWQPTPVFLPGEPQDGGAWWAAVYRVAQSQTQLKWLSSSNCSQLIVFL